MTDLYLIAHKVRGEPAFDIAERMECPECGGENNSLGYQDCTECDGLGYWWIIPTSGHRAYPSDYAPLSGFYSNMGERILDVLALPTESLQDHYPTSAAPKQDLISLLGLIHKPLAPAAPIKRRF